MALLQMDVNVSRETTIRGGGKNRRADLLEKTSESEIDRRISESISRLTAELDKARAHQEEGKKLLLEAEQLEGCSDLSNCSPMQRFVAAVNSPHSHADGTSREEESPGSSLPSDPPAPTEAGRTIRTNPPPIIGHDAASVLSSPLASPLTDTPPAQAEEAEESFLIPSPLPPPKPQPQYTKSNDRAMPTQVGRRTPTRKSTPTRKRSSSTGSFGHVAPRYMDPVKNSIFSLPQEKARKKDPFLGEHLRTIKSNGLHRVQPRLYDTPSKKPTPALPEKQKDPMLVQHRAMKRKLGYGDVTSRLFDNTYGIAGVGVSAQLSAAAGAKGAPSRTPQTTNTPTPGRARSRTTRRALSPNHAKSTPVRSASSMCFRAATPPRMGPAHRRHQATTGKSPRTKARKEAEAPATAAAVKGGGASDVLALLKTAHAKERDGCTDEAEDVHLKVLNARRTSHGGDHPSVIASFVGLAILAEGAAKWDAASLYYREALNSTMRVMPGTNKHLSLKLGLCKALVNLSKCVEAVPMCRELLAEASAAFPSDHYINCGARHWLAQALTRGSDFSFTEEAVELKKLNIALGYTPQQ